MDLGFTLTIVGTILAVVGFPFTYYMGRRTRQRPDLCYVRDFDVLMSPKDGLAGGNLRLAVDGQEVKSISRTYVALFNSKGDPIAGSDVVTLDPLRLTVEKDDSILQARVMSQSRPQCGVALHVPEDDDKTVHLNFDFFDAKDGAIVEVVHQGSTPVAVQGTIRGVTFRSKGKADLSPSAIRMVAAKTPIGRLKLRFKDNKKITAVVMVLPLIMLGVGVVTMIALMNATGENTVAPIPIDGIDMSTTEGQRQFLAAARKAGIASLEVKDLLIALGVFVVGPAILSILATWTYLRAVVPKTLAADIKQEELIEPEA